MHLCQVRSDISIRYLIDREWQEFGGIKSSEEFQFWNSLTAKFSASSNLPFLLIQLPQIILNARNLLAGNKSALLAVPWLVMFVVLATHLPFFPYPMLFVPRLPFAGYADRIARESIAAIIFCEEEGEGGCCGADPRGGFHIRRGVSTGHGIGYASSYLCRGICGGRIRSCFELHVLLWLPKSENLELLGGLHHHRRTFCSSSGTSLCSLHMLTDNNETYSQYEKTTALFMCR